MLLLPRFINKLRTKAEIRKIDRLINELQIRILVGNGRDDSKKAHLVRLENERDRLKNEALTSKR